MVSVEHEKSGEGTGKHRPLAGDHLYMVETKESSRKSDSALCLIGHAGNTAGIKLTCPPHRSHKNTLKFENLPREDALKLREALGRSR